MSEQRQFCTFLLESHCFGVEVREVQEVIRPQQTTRVPLAAPMIRGLINLRGQIVTALDLRRRLGMNELPSNRAPMNVVVRTADGLLSLQVDAIGDVLDVSDERFERLPETLKGEAREFLRGAYKLDGRLLLVLDTERIANLGGEPGAPDFPVRVQTGRPSGLERGPR